MQLSRRHKRRLVAEINVVPYIDVMLVLLIVFMVTAPLLMQGVEVELPEAPSAPIEDEDDSEPLIVSIKADGSLYITIGGDPEAERPLEEIQDLVGKLLNQQPATPVLVWGDAAVPYGDVVQLMTSLQQAGAPKVGLVTDPPTDF